MPPITFSSPRSRLAFALDYPSLDSATRQLLPLVPFIGIAKVGLELFVAHGPQAPRDIANLGVEVFLDLKLHDIPQTVDRAIANACALNARFVTIHASGGRAMLESAARRCETDNPNTLPVAVTVLTSLDAADLQSAGVANSPQDQVLRLARLAVDAGVPALVCSPQEVATIRRHIGHSPILITPGIRLQSSADDQKRIATPADSIAAGSDILVVGRPIRDARDPVAAAQLIVDQIQLGLTTRNEG